MDLKVSGSRVRKHGVADCAELEDEERIKNLGKVISRLDEGRSCGCRVSRRERRGSQDNKTG